MSFTTNTTYYTFNEEYQLTVPMTVTKRTAKFITIEIPSVYKHEDKSWEDTQTYKTKINKLGDIENITTPKYKIITMFMPGFVTHIEDLNFVSTNTD
jgi:hypothetical protein